MDTDLVEPPYEHNDKSPSKSEAKLIMPNYQVIPMMPVRSLDSCLAGEYNLWVKITTSEDTSED